MNIPLIPFILGLGIISLALLIHIVILIILIKDYMEDEDI